MKCYHYRSTFQSCSISNLNTHMTTNCLNFSKKNFTNNNCYELWIRTNDYPKTIHFIRIRHPWWSRLRGIQTISSVARGGGGGSSPPIGLWSVQNRMLFVLLRPIWCEKWKIAPPIRKQPPLKRLNLTKLQPKFWWRPFFFFFWRSPNFGQKKPMNFGFRPKNHSEFWRRPFFFFFFGDHPTLIEKKLWISELSETFRLKFRTNRLKLIQDQWKFESRSFAHFSLFQNSPPLFQILATRLQTIEFLIFVCDLYCIMMFALANAVKHFFKLVEFKVFSLPFWNNVYFLK